jgi:hypothetical protein
MTIFTGYGNPYQCHAGRMKVDSLGPGRYRVTACGVGTRVRLDRELLRFLRHLAQAGMLSRAVDATECEGIVATYMRAYEADCRTPGGGLWTRG